MTRRVLITAGGSGGHIFPAIALCASLETILPGIEIRFIGSSKELDRRIFEKEGFKYFLISDNKLPFGLSPRIAVFFMKLFFDIIKTFRIFISFRPDLVVGFGGYVSFPAMFMAGFFRVPRLMHEQNVIPGRANKFMLSWADKIALSFEGTRNFLGTNSKKAVFTGNPIRKGMLKNDRAGGIKKFGLESSKFTILVIGGSQGAHALNEKFTEAMSLIDEALRRTLQVIHLTGVKDYEWALSRYSAIAGLDHRVFSFIDRIEEAYSAADLIVTRSGSSALFEAAYFRKAMILVPYPFAMSHQTENALFFSENGAAITIEEKDLSAGVFKDSMTALINDRSKLNRMGEAARRLSVPDAAENIVKEMICLGEK